MNNMTYENKCLRCNKKYISGTNRPGYCPDCRKIRQKERNKDVCAICGKPFIVKSGSQILCEECIKNGVKLTKSKVNTKYRNKAYDTVTVYVPKGDKEKLKFYAAANGFKSLNEFINLLIEYGIKNDFCINDCISSDNTTDEELDEIPF